jgi:hypothetical protein
MADAQDRCCIATLSDGKTNPQNRAYTQSRWPPKPAGEFSVTLDRSNLRIRRREGRELGGQRFDSSPSASG